MSALAAIVDPETDMFRSDYAAHAAELPGAGVAWLAARRAKAMAAFAVSGVPTRRLEAWKYTDLASALADGLAPATPFQGAAPESDGAFDDIAGTRIVLVDGFLHSADKVSSDGLEILDLSRIDANTPAWVADRLGTTAASADQPLGAASLALMRGGVTIRVRGDVAAPLCLSFIHSEHAHSTMSHTRVLLVLESNASLTLLESHAGRNAASALTNIGVEIHLAPNARLTHVRLQEEVRTTIHVASMGAVLERDSRYRALFAHIGAKLSRVDMNIRLVASGAEALIHSVAALSGESVSDMTTVMDHESANTTSRQFFKSVVGGHARAVAQGRVLVREGAVKSHSHQLFKALLVSPRAEADAKPELEIYADDVICGHGTAIGALDADALFYLRARGLPETEARGLLIRAFLEDALQEFADVGVHDALWNRVDRALAEATAS